MLNHSKRLFVSTALVAGMALSGCATTSSSTFQAALHQANSISDPDRRHDAYLSLAVSNQTEQLAKATAIAENALLYRSADFVRDSQPLLNTMKGLRRDQTSTKQQVLARLATGGDSDAVATTRQADKLVHRLCREPDVASFNIRSSALDKAAGLMAEACYLTLHNSATAGQHQMLKAIATYEEAALESVLPAYLFHHSADMPKPIAALLAGLCQQKIELQCHLVR